MAIRIDQGLSGELLLSFDYNKEYVARVRKIPGQIWDPENKYWIIPNNKKSIELFSNHLTNRLFQIIQA